MSAVRSWVGVACAIVIGACGGRDGGSVRVAGERGHGDEHEHGRERGHGHGREHEPGHGDEHGDGHVHERGDEDGREHGDEREHDDEGEHGDEGGREDERGDEGEGGSPTNGRGAAACPSADRIPEGMACVPGGTFVRGADDGPPIERPAASIFVSTFLMDTHEVTQAQYRECVAAGRCRRSMPFVGYMGDAQPVVAMRWSDADAYCTWREKRLPTEAEWERAAAGPSDARYPWGDDDADPCERAIVRVREGRGCGREATWPVGSRAPNAWGLYDMAGNAWEWVADHHSRCYRGCARECGDACFGEDPRGMCGDAHAACPEALGQRTVRGGSWWYTIDHATTTYRRGVPADNPTSHRFGFRCARDLEIAR